MPGGPGMPGGPAILDRRALARLLGFIAHPIRFAFLFLIAPGYIRADSSNVASLTGGRTRMDIREFQKQIETIYFEKDNARGLAGTFMWFSEEVGELSRALRRKDDKELRAEFADVLAWLSTLASIAGIDLEAAAYEKYGKGCPRCRKTPCGCAEPKRPCESV